MVSVRWTRSFSFVEVVESKFKYTAGENFKDNSMELVRCSHRAADNYFRLGIKRWRYGSPVTAEQTQVV